MRLKGKPLSLIAKLIGALIAVAGLAAKIWIRPDLDIDSVLKVACIVVLFFSPIDISLIAENVFGARFRFPQGLGPGSPTEGK